MTASTAPIGAPHPRGAGVTVGIYTHVRGRLAELGYRAEYDAAQSAAPPGDPEELARRCVWAILSSGAEHASARRTLDKIWPKLTTGAGVYRVFGHRSKARAAEEIWASRSRLFAELAQSSDVAAWCGQLPWVTGEARHELARSLGGDVVRRDRSLARLAEASGETVEELCARLARDSGDRATTVDLVLWRSCAIGLITVVGRSVSVHE